MMKNLRLLCHNVFWFQGYLFKTDQPLVPNQTIIVKLCELYRTVAPDVICLQEIQNVETFEKVAEVLQMDGKWCPGIDLPQYGGAMLWRKSLNGDIGRDARTAKLRTQRMWQMLRIDIGQQIIRICNVHLPSSRQLGEEMAAIHRINELKEAANDGEIPPEIVAGDMNEWPGNAVTATMQLCGYSDLAVLAGCGKQPSNIGVNRGDYIWSNRFFTDKFVSYGVITKEQLACSGFAGLPAEKTYLSDHLPIWAEFKM